MPTDPAKPFADLARRWHALAERGLDYYAELYRSGRWRLYYATRQEFAARVLDVIRTAKIWAELAGQQPAARVPPASADREVLRSAA
jgi:hypothetical protein